MQLRMVRSATSVLPWYEMNQIGQYRSGRCADQHVLIGFVRNRIDERLNSIKGLITFERSSTEVIEFCNWNQSWFLIVCTVSHRRHGDFFVILR